MRQRTKRKRILGICLILLMLLMTACGINEKSTPGTRQETQSDVQQDEIEVQELESTVEEVKSEKEEAEPKTQNESNIQGESDTPEDASKAQGESDAPETEAEIQDQTSETEDFQENTTDDKLPTYGNNYYDLVNVVLYLDVYDELPPNYITKSEAQALGWEGGSVEKYKEGAAIGGDTFGNREGLLPAADGRKYTECDIDTHGYSSRGARRLVFSNDGLYYYTSDHYESFSEVTVTENYEVIW